ncbi:MAG: gliding motility-associated C-terminal domain-containing protein [Flavobacteriales bacterium]|jgi:gliding motility-associated-like protein
MRLTFALILCVISSSISNAQTSTGDCEGAIPLCGGVYSEESAPPGTGNVFEFTGTCNNFTETMSLWYTFTVQQPGDLSFIITPNNELDDYDWGLFNITEGGCVGITAQDGTSPEVSCNSYGSFTTNGPTGISTANGGTGNSNGPGDLNGPAFNANLNVEVGQTYALVVMNWSNSPDGYSIDFNESTATLFDDVQPEITAAIAACTNNLIELQFSELIVSSTVEAADFSLTGPAGSFTIASVDADNPNALYEDLFSLVLSEPVLQSGTYTLTIQDISGNVEDPCGNAAIAASFDLVFNEPINYTTAITTACNGSNGSVEVTNIAGGSGPYSTLLDGQPFSNGIAEGLTPGAYVLTVNDQQNCGFNLDIEIPNHDIVIEAVPQQDSISCSNTSVEIVGIVINPAQTTLNEWEYLASNATWEPLTFNTLNPSVVSAGTYRLTVTDEMSGCSASTTFEINNSNAAFIDLSDIRFPNIITPNGDSDNDIWMPFLKSNNSLVLPSIMDTYELRVFNRWGEMVFDSTTGNGRYWNVDGYAEGVYYYELYYRIVCGGLQEGTHHGHFQVIR